METENMKSKALENLLLNCKTCKKETNHIYSGRLAIEKKIQKYGGKTTVQKSEALSYTCSICKTDQEIPERRKYADRRRTWQ